jgi:hypothetical protein
VCRGIEFLITSAKPYTLPTLKDCLKTLGVIHPGSG